MANLLLHESSPYLLQHAHNPVNWRAWNDESLALAHQQNKLIIVSIGYSACHWCHVMEKQCFENEEAARLMNKYFICIKVDREERPDVDAIYMQALQMMNGQGGWPLNCFTLPDGRPVYGGTYFPLQKWLAVLENLQNIYETNLPAMEEYATRLTKGISQSQLYSLPQTWDEDNHNILHKSILNWKKHFDLNDGGTHHVPKFPMPCNYLFLLHYGLTENNKEIFNHVFHTLDKMSMGGLFDQIGGGFARYSTDAVWKVPHFEKMLYDNAQLISLYCVAYNCRVDDNYKMVIEKSLTFLFSQFNGPDGEYYSALDADSEGEEGKYYVWTQDELKELLGKDFELFSTYYNINEIGYWEYNSYLLIRTEKDAEFCIKNNLSIKEFELTRNTWNETLLSARQKRVMPGLDDKTLTSWNALMLKACLHAYLSLDNQQYYEAAEKSAHFILKNQIHSHAALYHSYKKGQSSINGFLEDYAFLADAFLLKYKVSGEEDWLITAREITDYAINHFFDETDGLFFFSSKLDKPLIVRQKEVQDNVIPSSNAVMAHVLFELSVYFEVQDYLKISKKMAAHFHDEIASFGSSYACWALLLLRLKLPVLQAAIPSSDFKETAKQLLKTNHLNLFPYSISLHTKLNFVADKKSENSYYLCIDNVCGLPLNNRNSLISAVVNI